MRTTGTPRTSSGSGRISQPRTWASFHAGIWERKEHPFAESFSAINLNHDATDYDRRGSQHGFMIVFFDMNALYEGGTKAMRGSKFKQTTQRYRCNQLLETARLADDLEKGTYEPQTGHKFLISERGHARYISSNVMRDKSLYHVLCDDVLTPAAAKFLIFDNSASQKGKGVDFERRRLVEHLRRYYATHGTNDGWIELFDFSGYYANIRHSVCLADTGTLLIKADVDPETVAYTIRLLRKIFKTYEVDVSRFTEDEIRRFMTEKVDPLINANVPGAELTGRRYLPKGVDIGAQPSQNVGISFPIPWDNYAKIVQGEKLYARYTDDSYAISEDRDDLEELRAGLSDIAARQGLIVNVKKTRITKISKPFRHLQVSYRLTETGRIERRINPKAITRERRKLKAYKRLLEAGRLEYPAIENAFKSWLGGHYKYMTHGQIYKLAGLFYELFGRRPTWRKGHSQLFWMMTHRSRASSSTGTALSAAPSSRRPTSRVSSPR